MKIDKWPEWPRFAILIFPIVYCVRINALPARLSGVIFSHRFLDSDCINFKTFAFLAVYWPFWTSLYSTDIKVQFFFYCSSTMLNNVFKVTHSLTSISMHEWRHIGLKFSSSTSDLRVESQRFDVLNLHDWLWASITVCSCSVWYYTGWPKNNGTAYLNCK